MRKNIVKMKMAEPAAGAAEKLKYYLAASIALITFLVYLPSLQNELIQWDDPDYISGNVHIRPLNAAFLKWAFSSFYAANWHPLTWISHAVDYAVWGLNPLGHHLTNNILHSLNTFIVVLLTVRLLDLFKKRTASRAPLDSRRVLIAAGATGLLFGLHPVHVESVAWASERKDLLCAFFSLLSVTAYLKYVSAAGGPNPPRFLNRQYLLSLGFFALALLSKPMAVSLPAVLLILDWYPSGRIQSMKSFRRAFLEKLPFISLTVISSVLTVLAQKAEGAMRIMETVPFSSRVLVAAKALVDYAGIIIWPAHLSPKYPYPRNVEILSAGYLLPLGLIFTIAALCVLLLNKQKMWTAASLFYAATLMPVLGLVQVGGQYMADRYTYLPSLGPFLLLGLALSWCCPPAAEKKRNRTLIAVLAAAAAVPVLIFMAYLTFRQINSWENDITLWTSAIEADPSDNFAYYQRGVAFHTRGRLDEAIADYRRSIYLEPYHEEAFYLLGMALSGSNRLDEAIDNYTRAIYIRPDFAPAYHQRGTVYLKRGDKGLALSDFQTACSLGDKNGCDALKGLVDDKSEAARSHVAEIPRGIVIQPVAYRL